MAELVHVHLLAFSHRRIRAKTKRKSLETILGWMDSPATIADASLRALEDGLGSPGTFFAHRYWQLVYLIRLCSAWKRASATDRDAMLKDAAAFREFAEDAGCSGQRFMRRLVGTGERRAPERPKTPP